MSYTLSNLDMNDPIAGGTPGSVLFVDSDFTLGQDNAKFFWDDTLNALYIGSNAPLLSTSGTLEVSTIHTLATGSNMVVELMTLNPVSQPIIGTVFRSLYHEVNNISAWASPRLAVEANFNRISNTGTGGLGGPRANYIQFIQSGSGDMVDPWGVDVLFIVSDGNIRRPVAYHADIPLLSGSGVITERFSGFQAENLGATGVPNVYAIDIKAQSGAATDNFSMRLGGGTAVINEDGTTSDFRVESSTDPNILRVGGATDLVTIADAGGSLFKVGTDDNTIILHAFGSTSAKMMLSAESQNTPIIMIQHSDTDSPTLPILRSRGTAASPTAVQNGDGLGAFAFGGYDGTDYVVGSIITNDVTGAVADGSIPNTLSAIIIDPDFNFWQAWAFGHSGSTINGAAGDSLDNNGKDIFITAGSAIAAGSGGEIQITTGSGTGGGEFTLHLQNNPTPLIKGVTIGGFDLFGVSSSLSGSKFTVSNDGGGSLNIMDLQSAGDTRLQVTDTGSIRHTGTTSGALTEAFPAAITSYTITWPAAQGGASTFLQNDGSGNLSWTAGGATSPGGADTQVQFNDGGAFGGDASFAWNKTTNRLTMKDNAQQKVDMNTYASSTASSQLFLAKARGSEGSEAVVASGDDLGNIIFRGFDGATFQDVAMIKATVDGTPGSSDVPTDLEFYTTRDGSSTSTRAMVISPNGYVGIGDFTGPNALLQVLQLDSSLNANITQQANQCNATLSVFRYADDADGGNADYIKTRGSLFSNTAVVADDSIYLQTYYGNVGTNGLVVAAQVQYQVVGPVTDATNGLGGAIHFKTSTPGSPQATKLSILDEGQLNMVATPAPTNVIQDGDLWNDSDRQTLVNRQKSTYLNIPSVLYTEIDDQIVTNTTTETTLIGTGIGSMTLGADFLTAGKTINAVLHGYYAHAAVTPGTIRLRGYVGSTVVLDTGTVNLSGAITTNRTFAFQSVMTCRTTGASGSVISQGELKEQGSSAFVLNTSPTTIDTTISQTLDFTIEFSLASTDNKVATTNIIIEVLN